MTESSGRNPRRGRPGSWTSRPRLNEEDLGLLQCLRHPGEDSATTLRRILREAVARAPVDAALRALEARLARLEVAGPRVPATAAATADAEASRRKAMQALRLHVDDEDG